MRQPSGVLSIENQNICFSYCENSLNCHDCSVLLQNNEGFRGTSSLLPENSKIAFLTKDNQLQLCDSKEAKIVEENNGLLYYNENFSTYIMLLLPGNHECIQNLSRRKMKAEILFNNLRIDNPVTWGYYEFSTYRKLNRNCALLRHLRFEADKKENNDNITSKDRDFIEACKQAYFVTDVYNDDDENNKIVMADICDINIYYDDDIIYTTNTQKKTSSVNLFNYVPDDANRMTVKGKKAGERKSINILNTEFSFRWCPAINSTFIGSNRYEIGHVDNEDLLYMGLNRGFWMLETEITQEMWENVMGNNPSHFKGAKRPVEQVSWEDCQEFLKKINQETGEKFTLPTEAQWEYACRARTTTPFSFGDNLNSEQANCLDSDYDKVTTKDRYSEETRDVGSYAANPWGLYDMHGNIEEWCSDWYNEHRSSSLIPVMNPKGGLSGTKRSCRGGSWGINFLNCRSAYRNSLEPSHRDFRHGFRICVETTNWW